MSRFITAPMALGEKVSDLGVWELLNSGGAPAGYVFETEPMAPLPGFSGAPINLFVAVDGEGRFIDVKLVSHNEPIFVSGLGEAPFRAFLEQYRGLSIAQPMVVGTPYGAAEDGSSLIYLDGVTKATASVRIAHESLLAATREVARDKMQGIATAPPATPDPTHAESLTWQDLVDQGLASHHMVTNAEVQELYAGTRWEHDDLQAVSDPQAAYLDLWIVDLGPPALARAVLDGPTRDRLAALQRLAPTEEPILLIEAGRHGLVGPDFVRNTAPDLITASQDDLPIALRDADIDVTTLPGVPEGRRMILRTDRRLGFDPSRPWMLGVTAVREHGQFRPEIGTRLLSLPHATDARFFLRPEAPRSQTPASDALRGRAGDLALLGGGLLVLFLAMGPLMSRLARRGVLTPVRLCFLALMTVFVGWWGQGQLTMATVLGVCRAALQNGSLAFLLYDPFGLMVWGAAVIGLVLWGRALFCGWLCPFGALQEGASHLGRRLRLPQIEPSPRWDHRLKSVKYLVLAGLIGVAALAPSEIDAALEVEPFKTAITTGFQREWYFTAYALFWLLLSLTLFKGFCRYVCPLGAVMAIGGFLRGRNWIARRQECGSPCQLCRVRCRYGAISKSGKVDYSECFGCLDCVQIIEDEAQCVPLILANRGKGREGLT